MHFWCTFKALTVGHRCTCVVFYIAEIWPVRTYYSPSSSAAEGQRKEKIPSHITLSDVLEKQIVLGIEKSQAYSALINSCQKAKCKTRNTPQMLLQHHHLWHLKAAPGLTRHQLRGLTIQPHSFFLFLFLLFFFSLPTSSWFNTTILSYLYLTTKNPHSKEKATSNKMFLRGHSHWLI